MTLTDDDVAALPVGPAPGEDLDGDGIANAPIHDVDGDGTANGDETFSYDGTNAGTALASGHSVTFDFDTDGTPFQNGFTGALLSPNKPAPEVNLANANVSGRHAERHRHERRPLQHHQHPGERAGRGLLGGRGAEGRDAASPRPISIPPPTGKQSPLNFQAAGVVFGIDQNNLVKVVYGRANNEFELTTDTGGGTTFPGPAAAEYGTISDIQLALELVINDNGADPATVSVKATATLYGADDLPLTGFDAIDIGTIPAPAGIAALVLAGNPIGAGVIQTSTKAAMAATASTCPTST